MIYLDHHATTPLDPLALEAMLPLLTERFANAGSITHQAGRGVAEQVEQSLGELATCLGAAQDELVVTSGATESNNLALFGFCLHPRQKRRKIVSLATEHHAILDPLKRLEKLGFEVELLPVKPQGDTACGEVDIQRFASAIDEQTALATVMLANNEIGTLQPLKQLADICHAQGCVLHSDATQAVGRIPVDVDQLAVDLMSFSGHKFYGPKGTGGLFVRNRGRRVRLQPQIIGGGQQYNLRAGTLNTAGLVGMQVALSQTLRNLSTDGPRIAGLRDRLWRGLRERLTFIELNGPDWQVEEDGTEGDSSPGAKRLAGNLNVSFYPLEGQSLMLEAPELAVSSGSACTSADPHPSHVLQAIGLTEDQARSSLRIGIGRFTTESEIDQAAAMLIDAAERLRRLL